MRVFEADFDVKKELTPERMLRSEEMVWNINNQAISIYDRKALLDFRQSAIEDKNWQSVKTSNQVLLELDFLEKRIIMDAYPSTLQIEHSSFCNAECIMCSHAFTKNHNAHNLSLELFSKIEYLLPYVVNVTLHGVGEAFINTNITHFMRRTYSPHSVFSSIRGCLSSGARKQIDFFMFPPNYKGAYINHYVTKTISEFCNKIKRGNAEKSFALDQGKLGERFHYFFMTNVKTQEKVDIFNKIFNTSFK